MNLSLELLFCGLILAAMMLRYVGRWLNTWQSVCVALVVIILAAVPYPWGASTWLLSYFAGFSVTAVVIALLAIAARIGLPAVLSARQMRPVCGLIVVTGLWFYPMSLGATAWDPYGAGFNSVYLPIGLLVIGLLALIGRYYLLCAILIVAQVAYAAGLLVSNNLWDYLIDPCLFLFALGWLLCHIFATRK